MQPELSRKLAGILGRHPASMAERVRIGAAAHRAGTWDKLPTEITELLAEIQARFGKVG